MLYEVWNQPTTGPLIVVERGPKGELGTHDKEKAIRWAKGKTRRHRHMDFLVRAEEKPYGAAEIVYRTRDDAELQEETKCWPDGTPVNKPQYPDANEADQGTAEG